MQQRYVNFRLGHMLCRVCGGVRNAPTATAIGLNASCPAFWGEGNRSAETCCRDLVRRELGCVHGRYRRWTTCSGGDDVSLHAGRLLHPQHGRRTLASSVRGSDPNPHSVLRGQQSLGIARGRMSTRKAANACQATYADTRGMNRSGEFSAAT